MMLVCPHCRHRIAWPKVWLISRWTSLRCETCGEKWNRRLDLQFGVLCCLLCVPFIYVMIRLLEGSIAVLYGIPLLVFWFVATGYLDAATIRLVPAAGLKGNQEGTTALD